MKLCIETAEPCDSEELRTLLIDAAEQLLGAGNALLEAKLPWDGHPILFADASGHPVLVSFDPEQGQSALLNGLRTSEQLASALPWINQVYEALARRQLPVRLVVVSRDYPPGSRAILSACPLLTLFRYRTLNINGETGLWLERMDDASNAPRHNDASDTPRPEPQPALERAAEPGGGSTPPAPGAALPSLSDEETAFFQQL